LSSGGEAHNELPPRVLALFRRRFQGHVEEGAGERPAPLNRARRDTQGGPDFLHLHATEEPVLDDAGESLVPILEPLERIVNVEKLQNLRILSGHPFVERYPNAVAGTLVGLVPAGVVDEHIPHDPRHEGQQLRPPLPLDLGPSGQLQVDLVDQRRRVQGVPLPLTLEVTVGESSKIVVQKGDQVVESFFVTGLPPIDQGRELFPIDRHPQTLTQLENSVPGMQVCMFASPTRTGLKF